eukprot:2128581-Amphidinium_carterae.1
MQIVISCLPDPAVELGEDSCALPVIALCTLQARRLRVLLRFRCPCNPRSGWRCLRRCFTHLAAQLGLAKQRAISTVHILLAGEAIRLCGAD